MLSEKVALGILYLLLVCVLVVIISVQIHNEEDSHEMQKYQVAGGKPLRFHVIGDFGDPDAKVAPKVSQVDEVAKAMSARTSEYPIDFIVSTGNNRYAKGVVDEFDQVVYRLMYHVFHKPGLKGKPWFVSLGTVDCMSDPGLEVKMTKLYSMWNMPAVYYNFTVELDNDKHALFVVMDSCTLACWPDPNMTLPQYCGQMYNTTTKEELETQRQWFYNVSEYYAQSDIDVQWSFVFLSVPPFSASSGDADNESIKKQILPLFVDMGVDAVFSGHESLMEYFYLDRRDELEIIELSPGETYACYNETYKPYGDTMHSIKGDALHTFVMGASGAPLTSLCPNKTTQTANLIFGSVSLGFLEVSVSSSEFVASFLQSNSSDAVFNITVLA